MANEARLKKEQEIEDSLYTHSGVRKYPFSGLVRPWKERGSFRDRYDQREYLEWLKKERPEDHKILMKAIAIASDDQRFKYGPWETRIITPQEQVRLDMVADEVKASLLEGYPWIENDDLWSAKERVDARLAGGLSEDSASPKSGPSPGDVGDEYGEKVAPRRSSTEGAVVDDELDAAVKNMNRALIRTYNKVQTKEVPDELNSERSRKLEELREKILDLKKIDTKSEFFARKDMIKGGLADKKKVGSFDRVWLKKGTKVEMEHTSNPKVAREIAMDHMAEFGPVYYRELEKMEARLRRVQNHAR